MFKKFRYPIFVSIFGVLVFLIICFKGKETSDPNQIPVLEERTDTVNHKEWLSVKTNADNYLKKIETNPDDINSKLKLAELYVQEARNTGNYSYYDGAVLQLINSVLANPQIDKGARNAEMKFQALAIKSLIYLNQHHFAEGLQIAEQARKVNPHNSFMYGCLVDANIELGKYDVALRMADTMCAIRPDLRSYSRISYLREINGNNRGAIEAMTLAVQAGVPGLEETEWARVHLGKLYENVGSVDTAEILYNMAMHYRKDYPFAVAGLARVATAKKDYSKAVKYYQTACKHMDNSGFADDLTNAYRWNNQPEKADKNAKIVIESLNQISTIGDNENEIGHFADMELAHAYLKTNDYEKALKHAKIEYDRRPDNIDVNETLAWVYYKMGDHMNAAKHIKVALKTGSQNAELLCHAGLIMMKSGNTKEGSSYLNRAVQINPYLSPDLQKEIQPLVQVKG